MNYLLTATCLVRSSPHRRRVPPRMRSVSPRYKPIN